MHSSIKVASILDRIDIVFATLYFVAFTTKTRQLKYTKQILSIRYRDFGACCPNNFDAISQLSASKCLINFAAFIFNLLHNSMSD